MTEPNDLNDPTAPVPPAPPAQRGKKDRLVQTRVPRELEHRIKEEAERRRVTVSQLVRNLLEDTVEFVGDVLVSVDDIVADSVEFAGNVGRDALRVAGAAAREGRRVNEEDRRRGRSSGRKRETSPTTAGQTGVAEPDESRDASLDHIDAWNPVVLNRAVACSQCGAELARGDHGYAGLGDGPIAWLCGGCIVEL